MHRLPGALGRAEQSARAAAAGQEDLFGMAPAPGPRRRPSPRTRANCCPSGAPAERLAGERDTLGLFLTGHPVDEVAADLAALTTARIAELAADRPAEGGERGYGMGRRDAVVGGLIVDMRRRGNRITLVLDDRSGRLEVTLFEETYQQCRHVVAKDAIVIAEGNLRFDDFIDDWRLTAKRVVVSMRPWRSARGACCCAATAGQQAPSWHGAAACARAVPRRALPGPDGLPRRGGGGRLQLGEQWRIRPSLELLHRLGSLVGAGQRAHGVRCTGGHCSLRAGDTAPWGAWGRHAEQCPPEQCPLAPVYFCTGL
jgi:DNA polymerase III subunit alpha